MLGQSNQGIEIDEYGTHLRLFIKSFRDELKVKERRELSTIERWQSRISGGGLLKFLRFMTNAALMEDYPVLREIQQQGRKLVVITDDPGFVAAQDVLRMFRPSAVWMLKSEWEVWKERPESIDHDFRLHFEYRSWWTQEGKESRVQGQSLTDRHWLHREGYTLNRDYLKDVLHLWEWTGDEMKLVEADIRVEST